ncbi:hypothetical protein M5D96_008616 [Drosophila gunungcola]|uniref:Uncharacterized protein n=1 Tax=Drosophila gunungcola TaxID=103775 RepID=A0A9P9YLC8_9MUSC|nr:hypothetical protein M5D96_008616 [Drosophila gunungcola]
MSVRYSLEIGVENKTYTENTAMAAGQWVGVGLGVERVLRGPGLKRAAKPGCPGAVRVSPNQRHARELPERHRGARHPAPPPAASRAGSGEENGYLRSVQRQGVQGVPHRPGVVQPRGPHRRLEERAGDHGAVGRAHLRSHGSVPRGSRENALRLCLSQLPHGGWTSREGSSLLRGLPGHAPAVLLQRLGAHRGEEGAQHVHQEPWPLPAAQLLRPAALQRLHAATQLLLHWSHRTQGVGSEL